MIIKCHTCGKKQDITNADYEALKCDQCEGYVITPKGEILGYSGESAAYEDDCMSGECE